MKLNVETEPWGVVRIDLVKVCTSRPLSRNPLLPIGTIAPSDGPPGRLALLTMDLRQLASLVAVADHRTFSAAAKALFTVQSNVSAHVARLERELGVTLVDRWPGHPHRGRPGRGGARPAGPGRAGRHCGPTSPPWAPRSPATSAWASSRPPPAGCSPGRRRAAGPPPQGAAGGHLGHHDVAAAPAGSPGRSTPRCSPCRSTTPSWPSSRSSTRTSCWSRRPATRSPIAWRSPWPRSPSTASSCRLPARRCATPSTSPPLAAGVRLCATAEIDGVRLIASLVLDGHGAGIVPYTTVPQQPRPRQGDHDPRPPEAAGRGGPASRASSSPRRATSCSTSCRRSSARGRPSPASTSMARTPPVAS